MSKKQSNYLSAMDFVIFCASLLLSALVGLFYAVHKRSEDTDRAAEFLMAGRKLLVLPGVSTSGECLASNYINNRFT